MSLMIRCKYVEKYSWAIPTWEAIKLLTEFPIVEMGAGTGYWASLIQGAGGVCIPMDCEVKEKTFTNVVYGVPELLKPFRDHALFLCWPPYNTPMAYKCLLNYPGNTVIYIGEGHGGCTGCDYFHEELSAKYKCIRTLDIPQFWGLHDYLSIWSKV
jgi:hypothetical protein